MKNLLTLIGGVSSLYSVLATLVAIGSVLFFLHNKYVSAPIKVAEEATTACLNDAITKDNAIRHAGGVISELSQKVYDLNTSLISAQIDRDIELINTRAEVEMLKRKLNYEDVNTSDELFYTNLPF